jgi:hypothetical protein
MSQRRRRLYWTCQIAGWILAQTVSLAFALSRPEARSIVGRYVIAFGAGAAIAIGWTHLYRTLMKRRRWLSLGVGPLVVRMLAACVVLAVAITATLTPIWLLVIGDLLHQIPISEWAPIAVASWAWSVFLWSTIYFAVHYVERWRQVELEKLQLVIVAKDAQLNGLMAQLQPHFLFNCLNCVRALIVEDPAKAQTAVTALSRLLRYSLQATKDSTVPLATEIEIVRTYLGLEAVRLEDRLATEIEIHDDTAALHVPAMLVQSLVENGVKHGIERVPAGGTIRVVSWLAGDALRIRVVNPGRIKPSAESTRIGLANARERLRLLYDDSATLALSDDEHTVVAEVSIPIAKAHA